MAKFSDLFKRNKPVQQVVPAVAAEILPILQTQNQQLTTTPSGDSTNSRNFFRRIFSRDSTATSSATVNSSTNNSGGNTDDSGDDDEDEDEDNDSDNGNDQELIRLPEVENLNLEQAPVANVDPEPYNFPIVVLNEDRVGFINALLPELSLHPAFNLNGIIDSLVESLDMETSDEFAWDILLARLVEENVSTIHDFKVAVLEAGVDNHTLQERILESFSKFVQQTSIATQLGCVRVLKFMTSQHYLCLMDTRAIWSDLLDLGFLKELQHRDVLLDLLDTERTYRDFSEFVNLFVDSHDWDQHFPIESEIQVGAPTAKEKPAIKLLPELATNPILSEIAKGEYECMICVEDIEPEGDVFWDCYKCHRVFHLSCISQWSSKGSTKEDDGSWYCPSCRHCHAQQRFTYRCWCKRVNNPVFNPNAPGSCGNVCGRNVRGGACKMTCHPGTHHHGTVLSLKKSTSTKPVKKSGMRAFARVVV